MIPMSNTRWGSIEELARQATEHHAKEREQIRQDEELPREPQEVVVDLRGFHLVSQDRGHIVMEDGIGNRLVIRNWHGRLIISNELWRSARKTSDE